MAHEPGIRLTARQQNILKGFFRCQTEAEYRQAVEKFEALVYQRLNGVGVDVDAFDTANEGLMLELALSLANELYQDFRSTGVASLTKKTPDSEPSYPIPWDAELLIRTFQRDAGLNKPSRLEAIAQLQRNGKLPQQYELKSGKFKDITPEAMNAAIEARLEDEFKHLRPVPKADLLFKPLGPE